MLARDRSEEYLHQWNVRPGRILAIHGSCIATTFGTDDGSNLTLSARSHYLRWFVDRGVAGLIHIVDVFRSKAGVRHQTFVGVEELADCILIEPGG